MDLRMQLGMLVRPVEAAASVVWSVGEVALCISRREHFTRDPVRAELLAEIAEAGFYRELAPGSVDLRLERDGRVHGPNPYVRVGARHDEHDHGGDGLGGDRVLGHLRRTPGARTLVVVCHCYGMPSPRLMSALFGLDSLGADVCTNIMAHHQPGTFPMWPGSGFTSARLSVLIENLRAAITGAHALTRFLVDRFAYERVVVLGFSIGGHLALHLANTAPVDAALAYCPMTSLHASVTELGLMPRLHGLVESQMRRVNPDFHLADLELTNPLAYPLGLAPEDLHVVVQRHDAMALPSQIAAIRARHPDAGWHELDGTHTLPLGARRLQTIVAELVRG